MMCFSSFWPIVARLGHQGSQFTNMGLGVKAVKGHMWGSILRNRASIHYHLFRVISSTYICSGCSQVAFTEGRKHVVLLRLERSSSLDPSNDHSTNASQLHSFQRSCGALLRTLRSLLLINHAFSRDDLLPGLRQVRQQLDEADTARLLALQAQHAIFEEEHGTFIARMLNHDKLSLHCQRTVRKYRLICKPIRYIEQQIVRCLTV